jgi:hypothetical protein
LGHSTGRNENVRSAIHLPAESARSANEGARPTHRLRVNSFDVAGTASGRPGPAPTRVLAWLGGSGAHATRPALDWAAPERAPIVQRRLGVYSARGMNVRRCSCLGCSAATSPNNLRLDRAAVSETASVCTSRLVPRNCSRGSASAPDTRGALAISRTHTDGCSCRDERLFPSARPLFEPVDEHVGEFAACALAISSTGFGIRSSVALRSCTSATDDFDTV